MDPSTKADPIEPLDKLSTGIKFANETVAIAKTRSRGQRDPDLESTFSEEKPSTDDRDYKKKQVRCSIDLFLDIAY